ncbi:MAG: phosphoribosylamine--glycine ligase, partial [Candidatus Hydrothermarchaeales archaeon]
GGGAREHTIAEALKRDPELTLYAAMKNRNPGITRLSLEVSNHDEMDVKKTVDFAKKSGVELAVVGPESPLAAGTADALEDVGIPCVGPKKALARIESDKEFMRGLMEKYRIPCSLRYRAFKDVAAAWEYLDEVGGEVAVKPVGLTGGKGVKVVGEQLQDDEEAKRYVREVIEEGIGGGKVVIEEKVVGEEFTLQTFVDGKNIALMPAVQDHKRAYEGDKGHNTGGMGSYSDSDFLLPFLEKSVYDRAGEVMKKTVKALREETGEEYKGVLYGQFMLGNELKLIEYNCRFGDPEAMNVLSIINTNMAEVCKSIVDGRLGEVQFENKATVCKYVAPEGYGIKSVSGQKLEVDEKAIEDAGALLYYAAVNEEDGQIFTTTSRSVGVVGIADTIVDAERTCEEAIQHISGDHIYHRKDIGTRELIERKLKSLKALR